MQEAKKQFIEKWSTWFILDKRKQKNQNGETSKGVGVETEVMLRCRYCNNPLAEYLEVDIDYDEGITAKMPFCDDQCLDAYKDVNPDYFW